jgi:hypothetical protein
MTCWQAIFGLFFVCLKRLISSRRREPLGASNLSFLKDLRPAVLRKLSPAMFARTLIYPNVKPFLFHIVSLFFSAEHDLVSYCVRHQHCFRQETPCRMIAVEMLHDPVKRYPLSERVCGWIYRCNAFKMKITMPLFQHAFIHPFSRHPEHDDGS